jgi:hypothetical protein
MQKKAARPLLTVLGIANAATITYPNFSSTAGFTLNGGAGAINTGGQGVPGAGGTDVLRLTNNLGQS